MAAEAGGLGVVVLSGDYVRVHYALMMASAAAAIDRPVTVFVTMDAAPLLAGDEGWRRLAGAERDDELKARDVADMETLLAACASMGVAFMACEAGLRAGETPAAALRDDLDIEVAGLVTFYRAVGEGRIVAL